MGSKVQDAAFLAAALIALVAFGLLILFTRPGGPSAGTSPSPTGLPAASFSPLPSISITAVPVTSTPTTAAPTTPAPTTAAPTPTVVPTTARPTPQPTKSP